MFDTREGEFANDRVHFWTDHQSRQSQKCAVASMECETKLQEEHLKTLYSCMPEVPSVVWPTILQSSSRTGGLFKGTGGGIWDAKLSHTVEFVDMLPALTLPVSEGPGVHAKCTLDSAESEEDVEAPQSCPQFRNLGVGIQGLLSVLYASWICVDLGDSESKVLEKFRTWP